MVRDKVQVDILTDTRQSQANLKQMVAGFFTAQAAWAAAQKVLQKTVELMRESVELAKAQEQAEARLAGVLKATGEAAGFNAQKLKDMAGGLQAVTTFGDEAIIGMQSVLLTFRNIQGEAFERTTELALDLSAAFGQDLKSSAMQLGKALEDPMTGLTALRRIGVSFTEEQETLIKSLVEAGEAAEAQAEILDVLEGQVGGVAREMALTSSGELEQMKNAMGDLKEEIGFLIMDGLEPFVGIIKKASEVNAAYLRSLREVRGTLEGLSDDVSERKYEELEGALADIDKAIEALIAKNEKFNLRDVFDPGAAVQRAAELKDLLEARAAIEAQMAEKHAEYVERKKEEREEEEELAKLAEERRRAAEAARKIEEEYKAVRKEVVRIIDSEKTELEKLEEQYDYLAAHPYASGELEQERLEAMQILLDRMREIRDAMEAAKLEQATLNDIGQKWKEDVTYVRDTFEDIEDTMSGLTWQMSSFGAPIAAMFGKLNKQIKTFNDAVDYLKEGLAAASGQGYLEAFEQMGRAFQEGQTAASAMTGALEDFVGAIINALPKLLFYAGVQLLSTPAWPMGIGLIIASGIAAIAKGAYNAEYGDSGTSGDGDNNNGGDNVTIIVEGSVVSEAGLERVVSNAQARNYGGY